MQLSAIDRDRIAMYLFSVICICDFMCRIDIFNKKIVGVFMMWHDDIWKKADRIIIKSAFHFKTDFKP